MLAEKTDIEILCSRVDHSEYAQNDMKKRAQQECCLVKLLLENSDIKNIANRYNEICDRTTSVWSNLCCRDSKEFSLDLEEIYNDCIKGIIEKQSVELASRLQNVFETTKELRKKRLALEMSCVAAKQDKVNDILDKIRGVDKDLFKCYGITTQVLNKIKKYNIKIIQQKEDKRKQEKLLHDKQVEENRNRRELDEEVKKAKPNNVIDITKTHIVLARQIKRRTR